MTTGGRRFRIALVLLVLALAYPAWLVFAGVVQSRTTTVDVPLVSDREVNVPVSVTWGGNFTLAIRARTTAGTDLQGMESCLLDLPDPKSQPVPCEGVADRLHLNFRVEDSAGKVVVGSYGLPMAGRYQDRDREYGPFLGEKEMGNELLMLEKLERGHYRLLATAVHVPAGLKDASPRLVFDRHTNQYEALTVLPLLLLSVVPGLAALVMFAASVVARKKTTE